MAVESDGRRYPAGHRVIKEPFGDSGVVHNPGEWGCTIILDEPMAHTDRVQGSWNEIWDEGDNLIYWAEFHLRRYENDASFAMKNLMAAQAASTAADEALRIETEKVQELKREYGRN